MLYSINWFARKYLNEEDVDTLENNKIKEFYYRYLWWPWQLFLVCLSIFFMLFGIMVLLHAYRLNDPFSFIITFFSSNLIILLSIVMIIAFVFRIIKVLRRSEGKINEPEDYNESE